LDILLLLLLLVLDLLLMLLILPFGTTPSVAATVTPHAAAEPLPLGLYGTMSPVFSCPSAQQKKMRKMEKDSGRAAGKCQTFFALYSSFATF